MASQSSNVAALVSAFDTSYPVGNHFGMHASSMGMTGRAQHGHAERGRSTRNRSRDRHGPRQYSAPQVDRNQPAGPMERTEWTDALADLSARISTIERTQSNHAQAIARMDTRASDHKAMSTEVNEDIHNYKQYVQGTFAKIDGYVCEQVKKVHDEAIANFTSIADVLGRIQADMIQLQALSTPLPAESSLFVSPRDMT